MTPAEFRSLLKLLGLRQVTLAEALGVAPLTVNRWATGKLGVPKYAITCLSLMQQLQEAEAPAD